MNAMNPFFSLVGRWSRRLLTREHRFGVSDLDRRMLRDIGLDGAEVPSILWDHPEAPRRVR